MDNAGIVAVAVGAFLVIFVLVFPRGVRLIWDYVRGTVTAEGKGGGARLRDADAGRDVRIEDATGSGAEAERLKAGQDITVSSKHDPKE